MEKTFTFWTHDGFDGSGFEVRASSFEEAIQKAGGVQVTWVSVTDGVETRRFNL